MRIINKTNTVLRRIRVKLFPNYLPGENESSLARICPKSGHDPEMRITSGATQYNGLRDRFLKKYKTMISDFELTA